MDGLLPAHEQRDHHVREHHHVAQRQDREDGGFGTIGHVGSGCGWRPGALGRLWGRRGNDASRVRLPTRAVGGWVVEAIVFGGGSRRLRGRDEGKWFYEMGMRGERWGGIVE